MKIVEKAKYRSILLKIEKGFISSWDEHTYSVFIPAQANRHQTKKFGGIYYHFFKKKLQLYK